jgi:hypothetical protein
LGDEAAGQFEESFVDVGSAFPANVEPAEAVQPGEGPLDHPPVDAESSAVAGVPAGNGGDDAAGSNLVTLDVVIVAAVGEE